MRRIRTEPTAEDAVAINALAALLLGGALLHPDVRAEMCGLVAEMLPRVSPDNPDMVALAARAGEMLAGRDGVERRGGHLAVAAILSDILRARAFGALARLQDRGAGHGAAAGGDR